MKRHILRILALGWLALASHAQLKVITTIPDLADITAEIGGDLVDVESIAKGTENIHAVALRPSHLVRASRADLLIQVGLSLEHAYVPGLIENSRNKRIRPGSPGFVNCSDGWEALDVPAEISRGQGADIHPFGNPHMNLDPRGGAHMAQRIYEGLVRVDPMNETAYAAGLAAYRAKLDAGAKRWAKLGAKLEGKRIVVYHNDFTYFARHYRMDVVASVEPSPGVPPSPRDLAHVVKTMRERDARVVLTAKWSNNKDVRFVADKAKAKLLEIPILVNGVSGVTTWIGMMDFLHESLADALAEED